MGSIRQILLGLICLGTAFGMGHYLNHKPIDNQLADQDLETNNPLSGPPSRLLDADTFVPESASIKRVETRFPQNAPWLNPRGSQQEDGSTGSGKDGSLPPPSELESMPHPQSARSEFGFKHRSKSLSASMPNVVANKSHRNIDVPDFSQLANEFADTPLELPGSGSDVSPHNGTRPSDTRLSQGDPGFVPNQHVTPEMRLKPAPELMPARTIPRANPIASELTNNPMARSMSADSQITNVQNIPPMSVPEFNDNPGLVEEPFADAPGTPEYSVSNETDQDDRFSTPLMDAPSAPNPHLGRDDPNSFVQDRQHDELRSVASFTGNEPTTSIMNRDDVEAEPISSAFVEPRHLAEEDAFRTPPQRDPRQIPFGLTQQAKTELVGLRRPEDRRLKVGARRFDEYVTQPGDTLPRLSERYYGQPDFYLDIYLANQDRLRNPAEVPPGIRLQIPIYE